MKPKKYNPEKEFNKLMKYIDRKFMLERCKLYKVRHSAKTDSLENLCKKYLYKLNKMNPWDIPDDEEGNAGFTSPIRNLEDRGIRLTLARLLNHPYQKEYEKSLMELVNFYIDHVFYHDSTDFFMKKYKSK